MGWIIYDFLCKSQLGESPTTLMVLLFMLLTVMSWGYTQVFTGRAALLHLGAFTATIMSANVFFIIMPNQRIVVADLQAGREPDAKYGKIAKLRSTHNKLSDVAGHLSDVVHPLPVSVRDGFQLDHCQPCVPDGGDDPPLV